MIGNESCDLDSAVCAISLAFFLFKNKKSAAIPENQSTERVLPILNIPRVDLPLKTEVVHLLKAQNINLDDIICRDEIELQNLVDEEKINLILVDHHLTPYGKKTISVIDHRPFDKNSNLNESCLKNIDLVGSCASLIADQIRKDVDLSVSSDFDEILKMLHVTTVLDTINFSKDADKARPLDVEVTEFIENHLKLENPLNYRQKSFEDLVNARADVSTLNTLQILSKDLKIISNPKGTLKIALPGFPISVKEYIQMPGAEENVKKFAETNNLDLVCLLGMRCVGNSCKRDLGFINFKNAELTEKVRISFYCKQF